jgi:hypothetical protein
MLLLQKVFMMNKSFAPKNDELLLSAFTALIIGGLIYQGCYALWYTKEESNTMFPKSMVVLPKK